MMAWVAANGGIRAIGNSGEVRVDTADWTGRPDGPALKRPADETVTGVVTGLGVSGRDATLTDATGRRRDDLAGGTELTTGEFLLATTPAGGESSRDSPAAGGAGGPPGSVEVLVRFSGPATVEDDGGSITVAFPEPTTVTVGFSDRVDDPATVTVPSTPAGVATGVSHLSAALRTTDPARSHPAMRDHPPVLEVGTETAIPDAVRAATPETGIEIRVPPQLEYVYVCAPLSYYLGADVTVVEECDPTLLAPTADVEYRFRRLPTFQHEVARLLQHVFFFDGLVRDVDGETSDQREKLAATFGLEAERVRERSPAERLARYFWAPKADLPAHLPEWPFSTHVSPEMHNVRCLPYLLDALSLVYLPEGSKVRGTDLLERTLDDCYRSSHASSAGVPSVDMVKPETGAGRIHGWLAPGAPIDAFKSTPAAYENRRQYRDRGTPLSVTVVLNDEEMSGEHAAVADIYRERAADLPLTVDVREYLTRDELADVFASPNDFVHYIGHCDVDGLRCVDGNFTAASLDACRTRTFFLNACGSYHEGLELVDGGSVGGAVTMTKVLDRQAAKVGTAFARLLVNGFGLEPAMHLSRRRVMMGKDYAVVGDGTYTLAPAPGKPTVGWLERVEGGYRLSCESLSGRAIGDTFSPPFDGAEYLQGTTATRTFAPDQLRTVLADSSFPVIYDGEFYWSEDLAADLGPDPGTDRR